MKKLNTSILLATLMIVATLSSCTIEKRQHMPGYSFDWFSKQKNTDKHHTAQAPRNKKTKAIATRNADNVIAQQIEATNNAEVAQMLTASSEPVVMPITTQKVSAPKVSYNAPATTTAVAQDVKADQPVVKAQITKAEKKATKPAPGGGKSQLIALLLAIFLGGLGIHRFYLGYTWQGVVQLLTGGGCGIWALIDLIRIIMGTLQPKNGPYDQTL